MSILLLFITIVLIISVSEIVKFFAKKKESVNGLQPDSGALISDDYAYKMLNAIEQPEGLLYHNPTHTWASLEMDNTVKIGLDSFILRMLGKIDKIESPEAGEELTENKNYLKLHSGSRSVRLSIPIRGRTALVNDFLISNPDRISSLRPEDRWIVKVEPENFKEDIPAFEYGKAAKQWMANEIAKLKDIISNNIIPDGLALKTSYDGGLPVSGISGLIDDDLWTLVKKEFFRDES